MNTITSNKVILVLVLVGLIGILSTIFLTSSSNAQDAREIKWLVAHEPVSLFEGAAKSFSEEIYERTDGRMTVTLLGPNDLGYTDSIPTEDVLELLNNNEIQLATTFATGLGETDRQFQAVNLPFLYNTLDEALADLDGENGTQLLENLSDNTSITGLAFTLSGGFRALASDSLFAKSPEDLDGRTVIVNSGEVGIKTFEELGAEAHTADELKSSDVPDVDFVEVTYTRISALENIPTFIKRISETNHSLFLTAIIAEDAFFNNLTTSDQQVLREASLNAAIIEREESILLGQAVRDKLLENGVEIYSPSDKQTKSFSEETSGIHTWFTGD